MGNYLIDPYSYYIRPQDEYPGDRSGDIQNPPLRRFARKLNNDTPSAGKTFPTVSVEVLPDQRIKISANKEYPDRTDMSGALNFLHSDKVGANSLRAIELQISVTAQDLTRRFDIGQNVNPFPVSVQLTDRNERVREEPIWSLLQSLPAEKMQAGGKVILNLAIDRYSGLSPQDIIQSVKRDFDNIVNANLEKLDQKGIQLEVNVSIMQ